MLRGVNVSPATEQPSIGQRPQALTDDLIRRYYAAFNAADPGGLLELLSDDVQHDLNQGETQLGKAAFRAHLNHMGAHYREQARDLTVLVSEDGVRAAAEFVIYGEYLRSDAGHPSARGQEYRLPAGAFFEVYGDRIVRVSVYSNLADWTRQVGG